MSSTLLQQRHGKSAKKMAFLKHAYQQTLDFDDTIDSADATNEGKTKEKILPQGTVHEIAREETSKQHKRDFRRLKNSRVKQLTSKNNNEYQNRKIEPNNVTNSNMPSSRNTPCIPRNNHIFPSSVHYQSSSSLINATFALPLPFNSN